MHTTTLRKELTNFAQSVGDEIVHVVIHGVPDLMRYSDMPDELLDDEFSLNPRWAHDDLVPLKMAWTTNFVCFYETTYYWDDEHEAETPHHVLRCINRNPPTVTYKMAPRRKFPKGDRNV